MPKKSYDDEYDYGDDEYEDTKGRIRKLKRETDNKKRKQWEREEVYDRDHDYDERR